MRMTGRMGRLLGVWACLWIAAPGAGADARTDLAENEAQAAAEVWLSFIDTGDYKMSWKTAAESFQVAVDKDDWGKTLRTVREPLGPVRSRTLKAKQYAPRLPGAPDGEYVVLQYTTVFEHKAETVETVTPMRQPDGTWRVAGYYIR